MNEGSTERDDTAKDRSSAEDDVRERLLRRLEIAQAAAGIGIHDYDIENDQIEWDSRVRAIWGVSAEEPVSYTTFASGVHPDDFPNVEQAVHKAFDPKGDGSYFARYRVISRNGSQYHVEATGRASFRDGKAIRLTGTVRDITNEVAAAQELENARLFAENLVQTAPTLLYIFDLVEQRNVFIGPQIREMANLSSSDYAQLGNQLLHAVIHPEDLDRVSSHHRKIRQGEINPPFEIEYRLRRSDGSWLWLSSKEVIHARDEQGLPTQILGASLDITRRREAESVREILIGEMAHRIKNILAIIQSITTMTLRKGCEPDVWAGFERRIAALASAYGLLTHGDWQRADLEELTQTALKPFNDQEGKRVRFSGPPVDIESTQVVTVALVLHELATNATKYGALSVPDGWVELEWFTEGVKTTLEWREKGGPVPSAIRTPGFGTMMIKSLMEANGQAAMNFSPEGLTCRLSL